MNKHAKTTITRHNTHISHKNIRDNGVLKIPRKERKQKEHTDAMKKKNNLEHA